MQLPCVPVAFQSGLLIVNTLSLLWLFNLKQSGYLRFPFTYTAMFFVGYTILNLNSSFLYQYRFIYMIRIDVLLIGVVLLCKIYKSGLFMKEMNYMWPRFYNSPVKGLNYGFYIIQIALIKL